MPDLNTVPASPRPDRQSPAPQVQTPSVPASPTLNILPSNQSAMNASSSTTAHAQPLAPYEAEAGPGPIRHPRPLTAAELHIELEKEQEAVVNRLTRELSLLRAAQNASVASNHSSTSNAASTHDQPPEPSLLTGSGFTIPRRHRRTSSSASQQLSLSYNGRNAMAMARQDSNASRRSRGPSPAPPMSGSLDPSSYFQQQRMPPPSAIPMAGGSATPMTASESQLSPGMVPATARYEETQYHKNELEAAKRENETLKRKIRELERTLQERARAERGAGGHTRSDSASTTRSMSVGVDPGGSVANVAGPRDRGRNNTLQSVTSVGVGVPEDEVRVGESASSAGVRNARANPR